MNCGEVDVSAKRPTHLAAHRSAARKAHFAAGRTPAMWLPLERRVDDRRKVVNRLACRGHRSRHDACAG